MDQVPVSEFLGLLQVLWDFLVQLSDGGQSRSWGSQHSLPDLAVKLTGTYNHLCLFEYLLHLLEDLAILVLECWEHTEHEPW